MPRPGIRLARIVRLGTEQPADAGLVQRFLRGEAAALEPIVHRHGPTVLGVCRRLLGGPTPTTRFRRPSSHWPCGRGPFGTPRYRAPGCTASRCGVVARRWAGGRAPPRSATRPGPRTRSPRSPGGNSAACSTRN